MREKIEQLYIEGMNNDIAPNVFAQTILNLFDNNESNIKKNTCVVCGKTLTDQKSDCCDLCWLKN